MSGQEARGCVGLICGRPLSEQEWRGCVRSNLWPSNEWTGVERLSDVWSTNEWTGVERLCDVWPTNEWTGVERLCEF
jgi:hypothetical protein